jgi:predicted enzyme related to lactoylglutathione lyase
VGQPVVHFEVIGKDPAGLRGYYGELFGWEFDTSSPVSEAVSEPANYGFVGGNTTSDGTGIPGGVGGGKGYDSHVIFYVGVPSVEAPTGLVVGHFTDPEGNLIGVAGTE